MEGSLTSVWVETYRDAFQKSISYAIEKSPVDTHCGAIRIVGSTARVAPKNYPISQ